MKHSTQTASRKKYGKLTFALLGVIALMAVVGVMLWHETERELAGADSKLSAPLPVPSQEQRRDTNAQISTKIGPMQVIAPQDWTIDSLTKTKEVVELVTYIAPNTVIDGPSGEPTSGARITVARNALSHAKTIEEFLDSDDSFSNKWGTNKTRTTILGIPALEIDLLYEPPGTHYTVLYKDGAEYSIGIDFRAYSNPDYAKDYEGVLSSLKFVEG